MEIEAPRKRKGDKLLAELKILKGRTIGILGLAFKPDTDDLRDPPAVDVVKRLLKRGAMVRVHDPVAMGRFRKEQSLDLQCCLTAEDVAAGADTLVLLTEWPQYQSLDWEMLAASMRSATMLDARNALDRARLTRAGFRYVAL